MSKSDVVERLLYSAKDMPTFQNMTYATPDAAINCDRGDIDLVQNLQTGLIYNKSFDDSLMVYDENYQNEQSLSTAFIAHLEQVSQIVADSMGNKNLIEVGCGKGFFLEMLQKKGFQVHGYDAAYEGDNRAITKTFFDESSAIKGGGIILRHVLEHIENPLLFLEKLKIDNGGKGKLYIEVPCFDWICENRAWFDICYEHVNYFRLSDLKKAFGTVLDSGHFFNGQYIYIVADLESLDSSAVVIDKEVDFPDDFLSTVPQRTSFNKEAVNFLWGASTKGVIFSVLSRRNDVQFEGAIDINPVKQGRYLPVTGMKVFSPDVLLEEKYKKAVIYIMNSNYYAEIVAATNNAFEYRKVDNG